MVYAKMKHTRLMLGRGGVPDLLVEVEEVYSPTHFDFWVLNGYWEGTHTNGYLTVHNCPGGSFSSLDKIEILTDNQARLRGNWNDVFTNFHDENYTGPLLRDTSDIFADADDDIPF